ncbi:hypothetical protein ES707_19847 [subsurface metagenome]
MEERSITRQTFLQTLGWGSVFLTIPDTIFTSCGETTVPSYLNGYELLYDESACYK